MIIVKSESEAQIYLEQVEKVDAMIENKLIEREQWRDLALSITAQMDGERVQSSGAKDKMAMAVEACLDMADEILKEVNNLVRVKKDVTQTIEELYSVTEYKVLHMRFIQYKTLQEIADHYGRDYEWAKKTCQRGMKHVCVVLKKRMSPFVPKCT